MTATDELRRLLDERGVEYEVGEQGWVFFEGNGLGWVFVGSDTHGQLLHKKLFITPEQAIAATMGTGTCEADETDVIKCWVKCKDEPSVEHMELIHVMECSACGGTYEYVNGGYEFCPRCGAKVVDE